MFIVLPGIIILGCVAVMVIVGGGIHLTRLSPAVTLTPEEMRARDALTDKHNKGWDWAEKRKVTDAATCDELADPDERYGCVVHTNVPKWRGNTTPNATRSLKTRALGLFGEFAFYRAAVTVALTDRCESPEPLCSSLAGRASR
jgi:hypothetical protein